MNCEHCQAELEDFHYGELNDDRSAEVKAHLAGCVVCAAARDEIERENEIFTQYFEQTSFEPTAEMWQTIRSRIGSEPLRQPQKTGNLLSDAVFTWLFKPAVIRQVAFAFLLIALSVSVTTFFLKRNGETDKDLARQNQPPVTTPSVTPTVSPSPAPGANQDLANTKTSNSGTVREQPFIRSVTSPVKQLTEQEILSRQIARAEREYRNAFKMLDQAIVKRKEGFDPELFRQYEGSLALIDSSIATSRRALRERPNDLATRQFLLAAYARKVELMQDFAMR